MKTLPIKQIQVTSSKYGFLPPQTAPNLQLQQSMTDVGLLNPIMVDAEYHLISGYQRLISAKALAWETIDCHILTISTQQILQLLAIEQQALLQQLIPKIRFLHLAKRLGLTREQILQFLPSLSLEPHDRVLRKCEAIAALPSIVLAFCQQKNFSLRQCSHLSRHPPQLLEWLFQWQTQLSLTASITEEILNHLKDDLRANGLKVDDLDQDNELQQCLHVTLSPQEKTKQLRELLYQRRYPTIVQNNQRLNATYQAMQLPNNVTINWDKSLEKHEVNINIQLTQAQQWVAIMQQFNQTDHTPHLQQLFDEL